MLGQTSNRFAITLGSAVDRRKHEYKIRGSTIRQVKTTNILGIPIDNKLKLDLKSREHKDKIITSINKLHSLNGLGLVNSAIEWRSLIDRYIKSRIIINNWPIIIIDCAARKRADASSEQ